MKLNVKPKITLITHQGLVYVSNKAAYCLLC